MDEYAALAQRVVLTMDDVRGCLVLSRDGLVLGAYPEEEEQAFKPAWLKFVHVGEARRGFVEFSDQMWAYVHRGPYAAFVIAGTAVRPGVLLDQLEQAVLAAEESRAKKGETLKVPEAPGAPSGRPRTSLHPPDRQSSAPTPVGPAPPPERAWARGTPVDPARPSPTPQRPLAEVAPGGGDDPQDPGRPPRDDGQPATSGWQPEGASSAEPASFSETAPPPAARPGAFGTEGSPFARLEAEAAQAEAERSARGGASAPHPTGAQAPPDTPSPEAVPPPAAPEPTRPFRREPQRLVSSGWASTEETVAPPEEEPPEVDRVMLAKEFSGLLQLNEGGDEDSS